VLIELDAGTGTRRVDLFSYLDAAGEERAHDEEYAWIKTVRHLRVDGLPFRSRFTLRGDSLWWFAELYLHKQRAILNAFRTLAAFDALVERERPLAVRHLEGGIPEVLARAAGNRRVRYRGPTWRRWPGIRTARLDIRARLLAAAARASRMRRAEQRESTARVAAFIHTAFWRGDGEDGSAESYIGPVLHALEERLAAGGIHYVGIGPRANFRTRRWWHPVVDPLTGNAGRVVPIEQYAPPAALSASTDLFRRRHEMRRSLLRSDDLRAHAVLRGCDCWPLVEEELGGIALLQWPWSARAMDEAAAALERLRPAVAVTYAEAGGWGRAIALECRRRAIPLVALQHGFIYRHWLNYRHEADEMTADAQNPEDAGFPAPAATLLFDEQAAQHLKTAGRFAEDRLVVTGSARFDALAEGVRSVTREQVEAVRRTAGATERDALLVFAAKEREAAPFLPALVDAIGECSDVRLAIKPHPAETPDVYRAVAARAPNARVLDAHVPLPPLLAAARGIVTVNSTLAIDALHLGIPSLVIGLPNNLTPFVEAGLMLGVRSGENPAAALRQLLYNQEFRSTVESAVGRRSQPGGAATRAAAAILDRAAAETR
jgi:capsular polysaccharide biosynthesis protein